MKLINLFWKYLIYTILLTTFNQSVSSTEFLKNDTDEADLILQKTYSKQEKILKSEYLLGPGDKLFITFAGLDLYTSIYTINADGFIYLPEYLDLFVEGITLKELKNKLENLYENIMIEPSIHPLLISYRPITVYLQGEVQSPGLYKLDYLSQPNPLNLNINNKKTQQDASISPRLFDAIKKANGVTNYADLSKIKIIRKNSVTQGGGKIAAEINLLELFLNGNQEQNIRVFDGDSIIIPKNEEVLAKQLLAIESSNLNPENINVYITGNVEKSGSFTLKKGTTLIQGISSTGGTKISTGYIEFIRIKNNGNVQKSKFLYSPIASKNSYKNPVLKDGDIINVNKSIIGKTTTVLKEVSTPILTTYTLFDLFN